LLAIADRPVAVPTIASDIGACSESAIASATTRSRDASWRAVKANRGSVEQD
jgi:hypothetical protein